MKTIEPKITRLESLEDLNVLLEAKDIILMGEIPTLFLGHFLNGIRLAYRDPRGNDVIYEGFFTKDGISLNDDGSINYSQKYASPEVKIEGYDETFNFLGL